MAAPAVPVGARRFRTSVRSYQLTRTGCTLIWISDVTPGLERSSACRTRHSLAGTLIRDGNEIATAATPYATTHHFDHPRKAIDLIISHLGPDTDITTAVAVSQKELLLSLIQESSRLYEPC